MKMSCTVEQTEFLENLRLHLIDLSKGLEQDSGEDVADYALYRLQQVARHLSLQKEVDKRTGLLHFVAFAHLPFPFWSLDLFVGSLLFMTATSFCVIRRN